MEVGLKIPGQARLAKNNNKNSYIQGVVVTPLVPELGRQISEFEGTLVYRVLSRPAKAT